MDELRQFHAWTLDQPDDKRIYYRSRFRSWLKTARDFNNIKTNILPNQLIGLGGDMLRVVTSGEEAVLRSALYSVEQALKDHHSLLSSFVQSHKIRNLAESTIKKEEKFLTTWFEERGPSQRLLYVWEAMAGEDGRKLAVEYGQALLASGITTHTIRSYLGTLRRFFSFVLEHPVVFSDGCAVRLQDRYGIELTQPVSEFDMPRYVYSGERAGVPLDPEKLYEFYALLRKNYLPSGGCRSSVARQRNYAMAVLAGETGLRVDELIHLEVDKDLLFDSKKVQTRHAKAAKGSGKDAASPFSLLWQETPSNFTSHAFGLSSRGEDHSKQISRKLSQLAHLNLGPEALDIVSWLRKSGRRDGTILNNLTYIHRFFEWEHAPIHNWI